MNDLLKIMRATVAFDAINGNAFERSIVGKQFEESVKYIANLEAERDRLRVALQTIQKELNTETPKWKLCLIAKQALKGK